MSLDVFVRFDAKPGKLEQLSGELILLLEPTRAESGCTKIQLFEEKDRSGTFIIHSSWVDEAAFDAHAQLPHMQRFLNIVEELVTNPVKATRTRRMD